MTGNEIRVLAADRGVRLWEVAKQYGVTDSNFSRLLREDVDGKKLERVLRAIDAAAELKVAQKGSDGND